VHRPTVASLDVSLVSEKLASQIVYMHTPEVLSSTAVKLSWDVRRNRNFVEGFRIKYRIAAGTLIKMRAVLLVREVKGICCRSDLSDGNFRTYEGEKLCENIAFAIRTRSRRICFLRVQQQFHEYFGLEHIYIGVSGA